MITRQKLTITIDDSVWDAFIAKLAEENVFDDPAAAIEWLIKDNIADQLEAVRAGAAGDDGGDPDLTVWPYMTAGTPASWADAKAQAKSTGERQRTDRARWRHEERSRKFRESITHRLPMAFQEA